MAQPTCNPAGTYPATAELLIGAGAEADTHNSQGVPAIAIATRDVAEVLKAHGATCPSAGSQRRAPSERPYDGGCIQSASASGTE